MGAAAGVGALGAEVAVGAIAVGAGADVAGGAVASGSSVAAPPQPRAVKKTSAKAVIKINAGFLNRLRVILDLQSTRIQYECGNAFRNSSSPS